KEIHECIVVGLNAEFDDASKLTEWLERQVIPWCKSNYRIANEEIAIFGTGKLGALALQLMLNGSGIASAFIVSDPDITIGRKVLSQFQNSGKLTARKMPRLTLTSHGISSEQFCSTLQAVLGSIVKISEQKLKDTPADDLGLPAAVHGMRSLWRTGTVYGKAVASMSAPWAPIVFAALAPILRLILPKPVPVSGEHNPYLIYSKAIERNFEVFVSLPRSFTAGSSRRYPAMYVLDANIEFSTVAEAAQSMAASGLIEEVIVIGIGAPRSEGAVVFGYRRFEEFSPPTDGYDFKDDLGRIFRSLFCILGQDARERLGRAPLLFNFIVNELLPKLSMQYPIDQSNTALLGHSAGGTFILYALCQANSPFKHYAGISPGLAVSGSWLLNRHDADFRVSKSAQSVFLSLGSEEKTNLFNQYAGIDKTEAFSERLRHATDLSVTSMCLENETHTSTYPRAVINALSSAFPRKN
ncbi:MAG: alpha/beta hydrolase-fold protein, partial [Pseudomonadota bacterium]